ncbi:leucine-rich repeat protein [Leucobacter tenebrionis]|uniref:leucine-rich repeat protein n=1 Tax=Leucobacter tenebrionis TaxID=2873270 RepID=UPI001CA7612C|nr:leucine-rich repeat protein [Leucobacter tenebrionis]QZY53126.1 leucine-rich repeat protein [Leucobacter tenebrionis]
MNLESRDGRFVIIDENEVALADVVSNPRPRMVVPARLLEKEVVAVRGRAFTKAPVQTVFFSAPMREIAAEAFFQCRSVENLVLPDSIQEIGREAFADCIALKTVRIPVGVRKVPAGAFRGCASLTRVVFHSGVTEIAPDAFEGCAPNLRFIAEDGSFAQRWAHDQGVRVIQPLAPRVLAHGQRCHDFQPVAQGNIRSGTVLDADEVRLTLRMVCAILRVKVPARLQDQADLPFTLLCAGNGQPPPSSLYFGQFPVPRSRRAGTLFEQGVAMFVANRRLADPNGNPLPTLVVEKPREAYATVCAWIRRQHDAKIIALTGSIGKTTTKELVRLVASSERETLFSRGNANGPAQVGRYVQRLTSKTEVYVQEAGAAVSGLVERSARTLLPDAFILTNIGLSHIEGYGGKQENILADKVSFDRYMPDNGVAFLNYEDPKLREVELRHRVISYGVENKQADYVAENVRARNGTLAFDLVETATGIRVPALLHAFGQHNVLNAVVAFAVGRWLGISDEGIVAGLARYRAVGVRQNLFEAEGRYVYADCYNASLESVLSAMEAFRSIEPKDGGRRFFVFADIGSLGEQAEGVHRRLGQRIAEQGGIDRLYCFGENSAWTAEEARAGGVDVVHVLDRDELHARLRSDLEPNDAVAFKGSHNMALVLTIDALFGTSYMVQDGDLMRTIARDAPQEGVRFQVVRDYGAILRNLQKAFASDRLALPSQIDGAPLYLVAEAACARSRIRAVTVPEPVRGIGRSAFYRCRDLHEVSLPSSLRMIGSSAFGGCVALKEIEVPEGATTIGARAFSGCSALRRVSIPASVVTLGDEIFAGCPEVVVECPAGSVADRLIRERWPHIRREHGRGPA